MWTVVWTAAILLGAGSVAPLLAQGGMGGFGGPSVMGRGRQTGQRGGQAVRLRGFAAVNGIYDSGLSTISSDGITQSSGSGGVETIWGAYGSKNERRSGWGLDYQGDYRYYNGLKLWNGLSQTLTLTHSSQPWRRFSYDLSAMAGSTIRSFGAATTASGFDLTSNVAQIAAPQNSLFDLRTNFFGAAGGITYIHSSRLSTSLTGSGFTVRRRNRLPGVDGMIGRLDVAYRMSRRQTIGADVNYYKFDYTNAFGDVNVIDVGLLYSRQFGRQWEFVMRAGGMRVESFGTKVVNFEPEVAQLLGVGQTTEIFYLRTYQPSGAVRLSRSFKRGSVSAGYRISPNPGNGLLFASKQYQGDLTASWQATRRLVLILAGSRSRLTSVTSLAGSYEQYNFGGGVGYKFLRSMEFSGRIDRRVAHLNTGPNVGLNGTRMMAGITFSPGDVPLQWW